MRVDSHGMNVSKGLVTKNYGEGGLQNGRGGQVKFCPYVKGGGGKCFRHAEGGGGTKSFRVVFML